MASPPVHHNSTLQHWIVTGQVHILATPRSNNNKQTNKQQVAEAGWENHSLLTELLLCYIIVP